MQLITSYIFQALISVLRRNELMYICYYTAHVQLIIEILILWKKKTKLLGGLLMIFSEWLFPILDTDGLIVSKDEKITPSP